MQPRPGDDASSQAGVHEGNGAFQVDRPPSAVEGGTLPSRRRESVNRRDLRVVEWLAVVSHGGAGASPHVCPKDRVDRERCHRGRVPPVEGIHTVDVRRGPTGEDRVPAEQGRHVEDALGGRRFLTHGLRGDVEATSRTTPSRSAQHVRGDAGRHQVGLRPWPMTTSKVGREARSRHGPSVPADGVQLLASSTGGQTGAVAGSGCVPNPATAPVCLLGRRAERGQSLTERTKLPLV